MFKFGIEEEFFLVNADTKSAARTMPATFLEVAKKATDGRVSGELLQSQIEIATRPHTDMETARVELRFLRQTLAKTAAEYGLAIFAAGTHPTAAWRGMRQSDSERHDNVMRDLQMIGQRSMVCGMHVHVELPDPDKRVDVMTRALPYLPLFAALSASSPFWDSRSTGLKSYRLAVLDEEPRSGVPELFRTKEEFDTYVSALVRSGMIADASFVWGMIRPSLHYPTLELRAPDCCTLVEDSIAIAALYRVLVRYLTRDPQINRDIDAVRRALVIENKWRAQRYGVHGTFADVTGAISVAGMLDHLIREITPDAEALGCLPELRRCRAIVSAGSSADTQMAMFKAHGLGGVTDWIAAATLR